MLTLALGIGLATVVFTVVNGVLLRPLAYPDTDRLVTLWQFETGKGEREKPAPGNFIDWRDRSRSFEHLAAAIPYGYDLLGAGDPVGLSAFQITRGYLEALSIRPLVGRTFAADEYQPGGPRVVMLSEAIWREEYGGASDAIGKTVYLDGESYSIIGVLPFSMATLGWEWGGKTKADLWLPLDITQLGPSRSARGLSVMGG